VQRGPGRVGNVMIHTHTHTHTRAQSSHMHVRHCRKRNTMLLLVSSDQESQTCSSFLQRSSLSLWVSASAAWTQEKYGAGCPGKGMFVSAFASYAVRMVLIHTRRRTTFPCAHAKIYYTVAVECLKAVWSVALLSTIVCAPCR
jgi:hypothetical protein